MSLREDVILLGVYTDNIPLFDKHVAGKNIAGKCAMQKRQILVGDSMAMAGHHQTTS